MQKVYSRINWENEPSTKTALGEDNLNKMDYAIDTIDSRVVSLYGYQDRVAQSEENAKTSETNAKTSELNAKQSEELAKQYMEQAFSGTPEGYAALVNQVGLLDIAKSTGNTLYNSKKGGYRLNDLVGNTVQNGEQSQSTPIAIENTFDCVEMEQGSFDISNGNSVVNANSIRNKYSIPCKTGDVVKIVLEKPCGINGLFYNNNTHVSSAGDYTSVTERTFTIPSGVTKFNFRIVNTTLDTVGKITLTVNGKYVGQIVEHGKNLFIKSKATDGYGCGYTGVPYADSNLSISDYIEVDSTKKYVVYGIQCVNWFDEKRSHIKIVSESVLTPPSNAKYIRITYSLSLKDKVQLEVGETVTEYEEGKEIVTTFFLNEPLRATDRLVRKDGVIYENHRRATVVFDGSESDWKDGVTSNAPYGIRILGCELMSGTPNIKCSHYAVVDVNDTWVNYDYMVSITANKSIDLVFRDTSVSSLEEFKAKLQANPITVEYPLATPTLTPLDTESQLALNSLETFDTVTYIEVDSKVKPSGISGEYGTSQVGAYTLKCMNDNDIDRVEREEMKARLDELAVALVSQ